jgi:hypothetical protein
MSSNTTNGTTIAPEVAAFVTNTQALIVAGSVTGGVVVLLIAVIIVCCRCIRRQTSDEAKEKRRVKRRAAYERQKSLKAEEDEREVAKRAKNAGKTRRGRIVAYDETLAKSFSNVMGLLGRKPTGDERAQKEERMMSDEDDDDSAWELSSGDGVAGSSPRSSSVFSEASGRKRSGSRARTVSVIDGSVQGNPDNSRGNSPTDSIGDDAGTSDKQYCAVDMKSLSAPVINRATGPLILGSVRRLPMPRSAQEEAVLYNSRHSLFDAVANAHLAEDQKLREAQAQIDAELLTRKKREAELRALDAKHVVSGLRSAERRTVTPQHQMNQEQDANKRFRLSAVAPQDYMSVAL